MHGDDTRVRTNGEIGLWPQFFGKGASMVLTACERKLMTTDFQLTAVFKTL